MMTKKTTLILTIIIAIVLFIFTFYQYSSFFYLLLPNAVNIQFYSITEQLKGALFFSIVVGLSPILLYLTWLFSSIKTLKGKIFSSLVVVAFMTATLFLRHQILKTTMDRLSDFNLLTGENISNYYSVENLHFEYYLFVGLILGCMTSYLALRNKKSISF